MRNLLILLGAFILAQNWQLVWAWASGDLGYEPELHGEVILLSTAACSYCRKTRRYLALRNVPFTEYDVEKSARGYRMYQEAGAYGVPVLLIGDEVVQGFRPRNYEAAFERLSSRSPGSSPP